MSPTKVNAPITDNTERYDGIIEISSVQYDSDNIDLYGEDNEDYFNALVKDIKENGLKNPIILYDDDLCKSGHTRNKASKEAGYTHIPYIRSITKKPADRYKNMMALMMENMGRPASITRAYNQIKYAIAAYKETMGSEPTDVHVKTFICPAAQMSWNMYSNMKSLELERKDLFDRVMDSDGVALSPGKAHDLMIIDRRKAKTLPISKALDTIVENDDIKYAVNAVSNALNQVLDIKINSREGTQILAFDNIQQNIIGGLCHEIFVNGVSHSINHRRGIDGYSIAFPPKSHNDEDIQFQSLNAGIEVKSCMIKDGNKVSWVNSKPKTGYYLLAAFSDDYSYAVVGYGYLDAEVWKKAGRGPSRIDLEALIKSPIQFKFGELKKSKKDGKVYCYPSRLVA